MRNLVLAATCLTLAVGSASAQTTGLPWCQKVFFGVTSHDFGTVPKGAQLKHRFKMKNIYAVPLEITLVRTTCTCLTHTESHKVLQPQEEGWIDVNMDGRRFTGQKSITLYITVGPEFVSTAAIVVMANARADVVFNPGSLDFGVVRQGETQTQTIDVEYAGTLDWRILEVVKNAEAPFTVIPQEIYRKPPRLFSRNGEVGYRIAVTLKADLPPGPFRQELILKTNDPGTPVLTVEVEGNVQASLSVAPSVVRLGTIKMGKTITQRVAVRGSKPFRIVSIEGEGDGFTAIPAGQLAASHVLTIQFVPQRPGTIRRELRLRTDLDDGASTVVNLEGTVEP